MGKKVPILIIVGVLLVLVANAVSQQAQSMQRALVINPNISSVTNNYEGDVQWYDGGSYLHPNSTFGDDVNVSEGWLYVEENITGGSYVVANIECNQIVGGDDGDFCSDSSGGGSGESKWTDEGTYIQPNTSFADDVRIDGNVTLTTDSPLILGESEGDHYIYFYDGTSAIDEYLFWDNDGDDFYFSNDLAVTGYVYGVDIRSSGNLWTYGDIWTTGANDDLWLGHSTQGSALFRAYADGSLYITDVHSQDWSNVSITESQISDLGSYQTTPEDDQPDSDAEVPDDITVSTSNNITVNDAGEGLVLNGGGSTWFIYVNGSGYLIMEEV